MILAGIPADLTTSTAIIIGGFAFLAALTTGASAVMVAVLNNNATAQRDAALAAREEQAAQAKAQREAAEEVAAQARRTADLLVENNDRVAHATEETGQKLEHIRILVNSNLTAQMQDTFDSSTRELVTLNENVDLKHKLGFDPTAEALATIKATEERVAELRSQLDDRRSATAKAEAVDKAADVTTTTTTRIS